MPPPRIYSFAPLIPNHPLRRYLESAHNIHTHPLIAISKSSLAIVFHRPQTAGFIASVRGSRYTIAGLPVALLAA